MKNKIEILYLPNNKDVDLIRGHKVALIYDDEFDLWTLTTTRGSITRLDNDILKSIKNIINTLENEE